MSVPESRCDLTVIGAGITGMAAALFAANRGVSVTQVGITSEIIFSSGFFDLMGVHPIGEGKIWKNPWKAIDALTLEIPEHPYSRIPKKHILNALDEFIDGLEHTGLSYRKEPHRNSEVVMPVGTVKTTYCVPASMWNGVEALRTKEPCLIVNIRGLRGFSARRIAETLKPVWPDLRQSQISFPGYEKPGEVYPERMASSLMIAENRERLVEMVRPHTGDARRVGFPAIFGIQGTHKIMSDVEARIGLPIFEIPTMPPSIPGVRIKDAMNARLEAVGVRSLFNQRVLNVRPRKEGFTLQIGHTAVEHVVHSKAVILATGRFIGKGLTADRKQIREALFDLYVHQPGARKGWHRQHFLDPRGHSINLAGLEIDDHFRPLDKHGRPAFENLFAAGSILAHQDWMRMKCGSGLAIATAHAAVRSFVHSAQAESLGAKGSSN